jgi:hypothetical protein
VLIGRIDQRNGISGVVQVGSDRSAYRTRADYRDGRS